MGNKRVKLYKERGYIINGEQFEKIEKTIKSENKKKQDKIENEENNNKINFNVSLF